MSKLLFLFLLSCCLISACFGQDLKSNTAIAGTSGHNVQQQADLFKPEKKSVSLLSPKRIGLYSAILPGLGQAFNRQYWKIPIIYAGVGVAAYFIYNNQKNYNEFRSIYIGRLNNNPASFQLHPELTELSQVQDAMNYYQHYLDLTVVFTAAGYALQIMDALVFANLKGFDISPDISLRVQPVLYPTGGVGLGLAMTF